MQATAAYLNTASSPDDSRRAAREHGLDRVAGELQAAYGAARRLSSGEEVVFR